MVSARPSAAWCASFSLIRRRRLQAGKHRLRRRRYGNFALNEDGQEVPIGEIGEIVVRSRYLLQGIGGAQI